MSSEQSASICGATWPEDPNLVCVRPAGHRGGHSYDDPPIGYGTEESRVRAIQDLAAMARGEGLCPYCGGTGRRESFVLAMHSDVVDDCPECDGSGAFPPDFADSCCGKCPGDTCYVDQVLGN